MSELPVNILIPAIVSLAVVILGYFANRKLGIASGQLVLVRTLKDTVDAMGARVVQLSVDFEACKARLVAVESMKAAVEAREDDLEQTVDDLRAEVRALRKVKR